jgi:hypothetical protein
MPEATKDPRREAHMAEAQATAEEIAEVIAMKPHATTIDALLMMVQVLAKRHACCTQAASMCCMSLAIELGQVAASGGAGDRVVH